MVPSTTDDADTTGDTAAHAEQDDAQTTAASGEQATEDATSETTEAATEDTSEGAGADETSAEGAGERIGDKEGESQLSSEPVDVAPDPQQTGIEVSKPPRLDELSEEEVEEIRQERLDPDKRPDNVEVDNTQRDFDTSLGRFEDSEADPPESAPFFDPENPDNQDDDEADETDT